MAHISIAHLNNYIGKHAETAKVLRHYAYDTDYMNEDEKNSLKLNLADAYIEINKMDSAYVLIKDGLLDSKKIKMFTDIIRILGCLDIIICIPEIIRKPLMAY